MTRVTIRGSGQEVRLYERLWWPNPPAETRQQDSAGRRYRLVQILPPVPQRLEWINEANLKFEE